MHEKGVAGEARAAGRTARGTLLTPRCPRQFKYVHVDLGEDKPAWYAANFNPAGTVPAIYDDGKPVFESALCVEYLEDKFPGRGTALLPPGALGEASPPVPSVGGSYVCVARRRG